MDRINNGIQRFFDTAQLVAASFDLNEPATYWLEPKEIARIIGVPVTIGSCTQIGRWASSAGFKNRKSSGRRFILMPRPLR